MNLPNKITLTRIFLIPVFMALYLLDGVFPFARTAAAGVFMLAAFTDFLDGYVARKYNLVTDLGKFLDAIADKIVVLCALVLLIFADVTGNRWLHMSLMIFTAVIIVREMLVSAFRQIAAAKNVVIAADVYGKIKTAVQLVGLPFLLICTDLDGLLVKAGFDFPIFMLIGFVLMAASTLLTIFSGVHYILKNKEVLK